MKTRTRECDSQQMSVLGEPCEGVGEQFMSCEGNQSTLSQTSPGFYVSAVEVF